MLARAARSRRVVLAVNFVKFDHPWEIPIDKQIATVIDPIRPAIFETTGGSLFAPKFVPTATWAAFRPDAISFDGVFPFVTFPSRGCDRRHYVRVG